MDMEKNKFSQGRHLLKAHLCAIILLISVNVFVTISYVKKTPNKIYPQISTIIYYEIIRSLIKASGLTYYII
jgi:hypothetical protein